MAVKINLQFSDWYMFSISLFCNLSTADSLEEIIRNEGCTPATIGVENGKIVVGLDKSQIERFSNAQNSTKVSRRDLASILAMKQIGGTTVAATMLIAKMAGIRIFATGGIGGVHRGADTTFDISADLKELGCSRVAVICAGIKSILDIPKTLEYLETQGVPVTTFGPNKSFPGFFTSSSGFESRYATEHIDQLADALIIADKLDLIQGELIACPIPKRQEQAGFEIESAVKTALKEADKAGVRSQDVTPFLLRRLNELTKGESLKSNVALLQNNAEKAARLARSYSEKLGYRNKASIVFTNETPFHNGEQSRINEKPKIVVVGGTNVDFSIESDVEIQTDGATYPGRMTQHCGGVGRGHADALARLGNSVKLISVIGKDSLGQFIKDNCNHMDLSCMHELPESPTATWASVTVQNKLQFGIQSDIHHSLTPLMITDHESVISEAQLTVLDGNLSMETLAFTSALCEKHNVPVWFDPASRFKMSKIFEAASWNQLSAISPNWNEFLELLKCLNLPTNFLDDDNQLWPLESHSGFAAAIKSIFWNEKLKYLILTRGPNGTLVFSKDPDEVNHSIRCHQVPIPRFKELVSESGSGDSFNAGFIHGCVRQGPFLNHVMLIFRLDKT